MKNKFLELVEKVKTTGIVESLTNTSSKEEMSEVWQKFMDENPELCAKIEDWATEFKESNSGPIFGKGEKLENPLEITALIRTIDYDKYDVSEGEIFEIWEDLVDSVRGVGTAFAVTVAKHISIYNIIYLEAGVFFPACEHSEEIHSDVQSETANEEKCGEGASEMDGEDNPGEDATYSGEEAH